MRPWKGSHVYDAKVRDYMEKTETVEPSRTLSRAITPGRS
jgi:hypothetical protein